MYKSYYKYQQWKPLSCYPRVWNRYPTYFQNVYERVHFWTFQHLNKKVWKYELLTPKTKKVTITLKVRSAGSQTKSRDTCQTVGPECFFFRDASEGVPLTFQVFWDLEIFQYSWRQDLSGSVIWASDTLHYHWKSVAPLEMSCNLLHHHWKSDEFCCITIEIMHCPMKSNGNQLHYYEINWKSVEISCIALWNQLNSVALPFETMKSITLPYETSWHLHYPMKSGFFKILL